MAGRAGVWAVVVAAGSGERFGSKKQFAMLGGRTVAELAVEAARSVAGGVVLVVPPAGTAAGPSTAGFAAGLPGGLARLVDRVVAGGPTRSASVRAGLAAVPDDVDVVVVHDAARPLASPGLFASVLAELDVEGVDAAIPAIALSDTLKRVEGRTVTATLDRSALVAVQTPQAFRADALRRAHASGGEATDDAAMVEALGATVHVVPGDPRNVKLTGPADLVVAEAMLRVSSSGEGQGAVPGKLGVPGMPGEPAGATGVTGPAGAAKEARWSGPIVPALRIGQGIDVHRFSGDPERPLVLGGVTVPGCAGLQGHSDADALSHALADAVLGASGLGDLGRHFPDTDDRWAGADSISLLAQVMAMAAQRGLRPLSADCTIMAERPALAAYAPGMSERLSGVLGAPVEVKATKAEGMGALGRGEGLACFAVVLMAASPQVLGGPGREGS
ncbi:MAG: 2-C-methyl-D-erythritol 4-phosphate cytidylyltransferase [Acidimicrobiales bacterium]